MSLLQHFNKKPLIPLVAYRYKDDIKTPLSFAKDVEKGAILYKNLVIEPGIYKVSDSLFDMRDPGLYKFYSLGKLSEQRLVRGLKLDETLSSFQWIFAYGNEDDKISMSKLKERILHQRLFITCTKIAFLVAQILEDCGFTARPVQLLTLEPWNYYDDGHTLLEIKDTAGKWILYDSTFFSFFLSAQKNLNAYDFCRIVKSGKEYSLKLIAKSMAIGKFVAGGYDFGFWAEQRMNDEQALRQWYHRMAGIPAIFDNGKWYFTADEPVEEKKIKLYSKTCYYLHPDEFLKRFYD